MRAPLRIRKLQTAGADVTEGRQAPGDMYMARLVKLIPSEVIGIFVAGKGYAEKWLGIWSLICLALVFVSRILGTSEPAKRVQWWGVGVSAVSFVIWVYAIGANILDFQLSDKGVAYIAVLLWTFAVPYLYKGD